MTFGIKIKILKLKTDIPAWIATGSQVKAQISRPGSKAISYEGCPKTK
jgi:hypothetical protein